MVEKEQDNKSITSTLNHFVRTHQTVLLNLFMRVVIIIVGSDAVDEETADILVSFADWFVSTTYKSYKRHK